MNSITSPTQVINRESFVLFVKGLKTDFDKNGSKWENSDLSGFLEAMETYAEDIQGYYDNLNTGINADVPSWRVFADILKGATMYE